MKHNTMKQSIPNADGLSQEVSARLMAYLSPLLTILDRQLDARLVRTFAATVVNIVRHRDRALSLLLTELGEMLTDGAHAPAGVKRLWRLLHSAKWKVSLVGDWLLGQADQGVEAAIAKDGTAFLALDRSGIEKPTARKLEGLTMVQSSVASLLHRASGGPPPKPPVFVPGFHWVAAVVTGLSGSLTLARLHWYSPTAPGGEAEQRREAQWTVLAPLIKRWGRKVICLLDQEFDSHPFLVELLTLSARFIVRWRGKFHLVDENGQEKRASELTRSMRSKWKMWLYDPQGHGWMHLGVTALPVWLPEHAEKLWLIVARRRGKESWWFLTTEDASTKAGVFFIVHGYMRRWQVEWAFRYGKSELGMASIRVRLWEYRTKLWAIAELVYAFLLHLLVLDSRLLKRILRWCHRTGQRWLKVIAPLYRLRHALANLWNIHGPTLAWSP